MPMMPHMRVGSLQQQQHRCHATDYVIQGWGFDNKTYHQQQVVKKLGSRSRKAMLLMPWQLPA